MPSSLHRLHWVVIVHLAVKQVCVALFVCAWGPLFCLLGLKQFVGGRPGDYPGLQRNTNGG